MNGDSPHGGRPWSVDLLADLHAESGDRSGLDADALAVLASLDATQADLASLPPMRMPDDVAARIDAALAAEATARRPPAPVVDLAEVRRRRNRGLGLGGGLLTAAAVAVGVVFAVLPSSTTGGTPQAAPDASTGQSGIQADPPNGAPLALRRKELPAAATKAFGAKDYGPFTDQRKLGECLGANGVAATTTPIGGRQVTVDGKPGVMLILPTGKAVRFQLLVVGTDCATGNPDTIANSTIGG
jgi:hypothetical protein